MPKPAGTLSGGILGAERKRESLAVTIAELNRMVHEPARLAILTVLATCESADFTYLEIATGVTKAICQCN